MNGKVVTSVSVAVAVIVAAFAGIFIVNNRAAIARANAAKAESEETAAKDAARKARAEQAAQEARAEAEENAAKAASENRKAKEAEAEAARLALEKSREDKAKAEADRKAREAEAQAAADARAVAKAALEKARLAGEKAKAEAQAESAKAQAAADALERQRLASEKVIAEAKLYELKERDLAALERELLDFKRDLDEREASLRPEKTIKDLVWVSKDDILFDESGVARRKEKVPYLAENDRTLPKESRELAKAERLDRERHAAFVASNRTNVVAALERLIDEASGEDRVADAEFYRKTLKAMYPDWVQKPPQKSKEEAGK